MSLFITETEFQSYSTISHIVKFLKENGAPPALLGFGISKPEHVKQTIADGADGAISGSALVKIVLEHLGDIDATYEALKKFVSEMKAATKR